MSCSCRINHSCVWWLFFAAKCSKGLLYLFALLPNIYPWSLWQCKYAPTSHHEPSCRTVPFASPRVYAVSFGSWKRTTWIKRIGRLKGGGGQSVLGSRQYKACGGEESDGEGYMKHCSSALRNLTSRNDILRNMKAVSGGRRLCSSLQILKKMHFLKSSHAKFDKVNSSSQIAKHLLALAELPRLIFFLLQSLHKEDAFKIPVTTELSWHVQSFVTE